MLSLFDPTNASLLVVAVVFAASVLQAITGIGFGVIAGPILLVTMGSAAAIQVSIVLSFLIAVVLSPTTLPHVNWRLLKPLFVGVCIGSPIGALAYRYLSLDTLKLLAALVVICMTAISAGLLKRYPVFEKDSKSRRRAVGAVSGALNTTLAMPGPPVAAFATAIKSDKSIVRATTLVTFLFAYPIALAFQAGIAGVSSEMVSTTLSLSLPTVVGAFSGLLVSRFVAEKIFKWLTIAFLLASAVSLLL